MWLPYRTDVHAALHSYVGWCTCESYKGFCPEKEQDPITLLDGNRIKDSYEIRFARVRPAGVSAG